MSRHDCRGSEGEGYSSAPRHLISRDAVLCSLLFLACVLITWPVAEIGVNDDWSYLLTTQAFVHTHHFVYNGWSAGILGWQVLWGALFAWLIHPSFVAIRLSMIPIALVTVVLYHAILRNFGLNRAHALFGTLTFVLSPLFIALSATFMTDISALFVIFLCIYLCQRALAAEDDKYAALWLAAAGLTNIALGSVRQVSWLGVLVIVPCCGWLLRRRRYIVPLTVILWILGVVSAKIMVAWFFRHPYSIPLTLFPKKIDAFAMIHLVRAPIQVITTTPLLLLPVLVTGVAARWPPSRNRVFRVVAAWLMVVAIYLVCKHVGKGDLPDYIWAGNIVTPYGIMQASDLFHSAHKLKENQILALAILVALCAISFIKAVSRPPSSAAPTAAPALPWRTISILLLPFLACYLLLLFPLVFLVIFDRYLLELIAVLLIYTLGWHQERISERIPKLAIVTLGVIAALGVAGTHDLFSMARGIVRATDELQKAGIPRTEIRGGFDYDMVTEAYTAGYVNDPHLVNPPGSFRPLLTDETSPCGDPLLVYLPAMHIRYEVTAAPGPCTAPTNFPPASYSTWLPPARRQLFVVAREPHPNSATKP